MVRCEIHISDELSGSGPVERGGGGTWASFGELDRNRWWSRYTLTDRASYAGCAAMGHEVGQTEQTGGDKEQWWMGWIVARARWGFVVDAMGKWRSGAEYPAAGHEDRLCMNDGRGAYLCLGIK